MGTIQTQLYPLEVSLHRVQKAWGGWPGKVGEIWSLSGPPHEGIVLNGPLAGRWLTEIVGDYQQALLGKDMELDPREPFPFSLKFVLAGRNLAVEVHPNDAHAIDKRLPMVGLDKIWVVLDAEPKGLLYLGFRESVTPEAVREASQDRSLPSRMNALSVMPGDVYTVPAGRAHAVGKGVKLLEIRKHSNLTFEIFDWDGVGTGFEEALEVLEFSAVTPKPIPRVPVRLGENRMEYLACTPRFLLRRLVIKGSLDLSHTGRRMHAYTGLRGSGWLRWGFTDVSIYIQPYQTVVVPAVAEDLFFVSDGVLELMETSVPDMAGEAFRHLRDLGIPKERAVLLGGDDYACILRECVPDLLK